MNFVLTDSWRKHTLGLGRDLYGGGGSKNPVFPPPPQTKLQNPNYTAIQSKGQQIVLFLDFFLLSYKVFLPKKEISVPSTGRGQIRKFHCASEF